MFSCRQGFIAKAQLFELLAGRTIPGGKGVCIEVRDWGMGFDPESIQENRHGLQGIRERARVLGGSVTIDTAVGPDSNGF